MSEIELEKEIDDLRKIAVDFELRLLAVEYVKCGMNKEAAIKKEIIDAFLDEVKEVTRKDFFVKTRKKEIVAIRNIIMYLMYRTFIKNLSFLDVANMVGLSNHSTAIHGIDTVNDMIFIKDQMYLEYIHTITPIFNKHFK